MSRTIYRCLTTVLASTIFVTLVMAQENGASLSIEKLIEQALQRNPGIKSAESRWRAWQERPTQVSTLPDPMFSYSRFGESVETRVGPQQSVLTLSQMIPFPGKLGLKGKMASQDALAVEQDYEATKRDVVFKVKQAYYDLYWVDQSIAILSEYLGILQDFTRVAEQKYATGQGIQANVLKSQVEISSTMERRLGFDKIRQGVVARINALLDRPQATELSAASKLDTSRVEFEEEVLVNLALSQREELLAVEAMIQKSEFMQSLARKEYLPDFNIRGFFPFTSSNAYPVKRL